jgi:hypothetical protein
VTYTYPNITENPISDGGKWKNQGAATGGWTLVQSNAGTLFGTNTVGGTADSYAYLDPSVGLGNDYVMTGVVHRDASVVDGGTDLEIELHIRMTDDATHVHTYEEDLSNTIGGSGYQFVRWTGTNGSFTDLSSQVTDSGLAHGTPQDNDSYTLQVKGLAVIAKVNGATMFTYTLGSGTGDGSPLTTGNPGVGFDLSAGATNGLLAWKSWSVSPLASVFTSAGTSTAKATAAALKSADASSTAAAVATGVGASLKSATLASAGVAVATGIGSSLKAADMASTGTSTAVAVGTSQISTGSAMSSPGMATGTAVSAALKSADMSGAGVSSATAESTSPQPPVVQPAQIQQISMGAGGSASKARHKRRRREREEEEMLLVASVLAQFLSHKHHRGAQQ